MLFVATLHVKHLSPSSETVSIALYRRCRGCLLSAGCGIAIAIVSTIDFDFGRDSLSDFGPANGRTPMRQE
jgi:hypothetical protein